MTDDKTDWITRYLEYTDNSEAPTIYDEWTAVSVIASAMRRKCFLPWGEMTFFPNLYVVLVGPSGGRKGTSMGVGAKFIRDLGIKTAAEAITREALIRTLGDSGTTDTDPQTGKITMHASLTIFSQELTVFLGYNNLQLMSDLTDWYDCRDTWTYRTKLSGTDEIIGVWVNLIGATTPELIQTTLPRDAIGGGLSSRIIFVYAAGKKRSIPFPFLTEKQVAQGEALRADLEKISMLSGPFHITEDFLELYGAWYMEQDRSPPFPNNPNFDGYTQRRPNHVLKLCLILSASERLDRIITGDIFKRAQDLLERTELRMPRVFAGYGSSVNANTLSRIMQFIAHYNTVSYTQVKRAFYSDVVNMEELDAMIDTLTQIGFCTSVIDQDGKKRITHNTSFDADSNTI